MPLTKNFFRNVDLQNSEKKRFLAGEPVAHIAPLDPLLYTSDLEKRQRSDNYATALEQHHLLGATLNEWRRTLTNLVRSLLLSAYFLSFMIVLSFMLAVICHSFCYSFLPLSKINQSYFTATFPMRALQKIVQFRWMTKLLDRREEILLSLFVIVIRAISTSVMPGNQKLVLIKTAVIW